MQAYPHHYGAHARAEPAGDVLVGSDDLPALKTAPPPQYGGPPGKWSPETLLVAAAVNCLVLTFRAVATGSKLPWKTLDCDGDGVLDRREGVVRFTELHLRARLVLPAGGDPERAKRLLEKAESVCLVTNSLALRPTVGAEVVVEAQASDGYRVVMASRTSAGFTALLAAANDVADRFDWERARRVVDDREGIARDVTAPGQ